MMLLDVFKQTWPFGLGVRVREVKPFMLRTWLAEQREKRDLKAAGANNYLRMLHGLFGLAVDLGAISENTARAIQLIHEESPERLTPSWQQAHTIIETVKRPKSRVALSAMLLLGLGQAELRNLRGEHFDLTRGCVMVRRQKTRKIFTVPIYPHARSFVEKLRDEGRLEPDKPVFQVRNPREAIALACRRLGVRVRCRAQVTSAAFPRSPDPHPGKQAPDGSDGAMAKLAGRARSGSEANPCGSVVSSPAGQFVGGSVPSHSHVGQSNY